MLACEALTLEIEGRAFCRELSLVLNGGELWGVLGPNGSGKTTLMHALAGVRAADAGRVVCDGRDVAALSSRERARRIALLPQQEEAEFWGTVRDYALLGRYPHAAAGWSLEDRRIAEAALEDSAVAHLAAREYGSLSGGERQRVRIAQLLAQQAAHLILDEPLLHLDLNHQARMLALVRRLAAGGRAVVMVLHDALWAARACTHVLLVDGAGHATGGESGRMLDRETLEQVYGCRLHEFAHGEARYMVPEI
jgi:iron complex transport system ATP-binding protein